MFIYLLDSLFFRQRKMKRIISVKLLRCLKRLMGHVISQLNGSIELKIL